VRHLSLYTLAVGLVSFCVCLADSPASGPLSPIVIGGDEPNPRGTSSCDRDFGSDALGAWVNRTVRTLCAQGDATSLLSVFLITAPTLGSQGGPDLATLDRAYAVGKSNPLVLWTVALTSKCHMPFQASECDRMLRAARLLTRVDPDNAMAWLTLGYAADESLANPDEISSAVNHAVSASRFHDYGFDLAKQVVVASRQVDIPAIALGRQTSDQFRLQFINPFVAPTSTIIGWLRQGCNASNAVPPPATQQCARAKELLKRGDSMETLSGDPDALAEIKTAKDAANPNDPAAYARTLIESIVESNNERESFSNMMKHARRQ